MRDDILGQLERALPVDGIVFNLHGAMVAAGYDDCEGDLLERARALAGAACVIGVELDPHCNLTEKRCRLADVIVLFKEYPHTDFTERGEELVDIVLKTIRGHAQTEDVALRLPGDRELPDHHRAHALACRQGKGDG